MSLTVSDALRENINCCTASNGGLVSLSSRRGSLSPNTVSKYFTQGFQNQILQQYIPTGTLLEEGFFAEVLLDLSTFSAFGTIAGIITVNGTIVGTIPEVTVASIEDLIDEIEAAVIAGGTSYLVTNNGDSTITFSSTVSGTSFNGAVVDIQINPSFEKVAQVVYDNRSWRQPIQINEPTSANYRKTLIANFGSASGFTIEVLYNQAASASIPVTFPVGAYALGHNPVTDQVVTGAFSSSNSVTVYDNVFSPAITYLIGSGVGWAVFNTFNNCFYFAATVASQVKKLDSSGAVTSITGTNLITKVFLDEKNGNVWAMHSDNIYIINQTDTIITTISTAGLGASDITYYPGDGTVGSERMFVTLATSGVIRAYNLNGTIATASFYTWANVRSVIYSRAFNMLFACNNADTRIIKMDATLRDTIVGEIVDVFVEDIPGGNVIGVDSTNTTSPGYVRYFGMVDDGEESYSGTLAGGTPDVFQTDADQCVEEDDMRVFIEKLKRECGCSECVTSNPVTVTPPPSATYVIYYGRSVETTLDATEIQALTSVSQTGFAGTYTFPTASPISYCYIAFPQSLGTPTRYYDTIGGLDFVIDTPVTVNINLIPYTLVRSINKMGGNQAVQIIP